ncbi:MAG: hypothetical protein HYX90_01710 [Chloroflexi bacterium]|nr:hypothetical protein [Chloroflexota bacterium]
MERPGEVNLEVYNPGGVLEVSVLHAPRLSTLEGKTICELSNDRWRDYATFPLIRKSLQERYPTAKIVPFTESPLGSYKIDVDDIGSVMKEKGCDAVIGGNAA